VVCASASNLGEALAYSGRQRGLEVTVAAARTANPLKLRQVAAFGADVRVDGEDIDDARLLAREIAEEDGAYLVEDSLDLATCEGAATIGLELVRDDPRLDVVSRQTGKEKRRERDTGARIVKSLSGGQSRGRPSSNACSLTRHHSRQPTN
jgi:threonine dehydratase